MYHCLIVLAQTNSISLRLSWPSEAEDKAHVPSDVDLRNWSKCNRLCFFSNETIINRVLLMFDFWLLLFVTRCLFFPIRRINFDVFLSPINYRIFFVFVFFCFLFVGKSWGWLFWTLFSEYYFSNVKSQILNWSIIPR